uniref:Mitochondrial import inner membrane translocase subunit TIM22 n=1 Tax=Rhodosorus marinus TaxID=101924 RepID=A0A7S3A1B0_9RHOD|mmetsp:Transcript_38402/g.151671  ORF Transcript_38402/g.151671 Transcript_38402/m.151671 type:complete len:166 (+) Transcript_38402:420-917(+)
MGFLLRILLLVTHNDIFWGWILCCYFFYCNRTMYEKVITVAIITATSFLNGAVIGGIFGFVSGAWSERTLQAAWANAKQNGGTWGSLGAAYSGLQTLARVAREKSDKYNSVIGACGSGALFSAPQGAQAAIRGCASFAMFSYLFETVVGHQPQERILEEKVMSGN